MTGKTLVVNVYSNITNRQTQGRFEITISPGYNSYNHSFVRSRTTAPMIEGFKPTTVLNGRGHYDNTISVHADGDHVYGKLRYYYNSYNAFLIFLESVPSP